MAKLRSGDCRYPVSIMRPVKNPADGGREGQPEVVEQKWYCKNSSRNGRTMEIARQMVPLVTHVLEGWNPGVEVKASDYVVLEGKRLNIEFSDPLQENGRVLMLVCIEQQ